MVDVLTVIHLQSTTAAFVLHFGKLGSRWGINRTVGQIFAPLFLSSRPLNANEIVVRLGFSRSNVSRGTEGVGKPAAGSGRVPCCIPKLARLLVARGTVPSAFWIIMLNSSIHTTAGFGLRVGVAHATDRLGFIFNPSVPGADDARRGPRRGHAADDRALHSPDLTCLRGQVPRACL